MGFRPRRTRAHQRLRMPVYPSGLDVSSSALRFLSARLREHRLRLGTRWWRLSAGRQALLALAHLRNGHPYAQLAAGFGIGTTTAYRYITEAVDVLAALAPSLADAVRAASRKAFVLLDGTLLPIERIAADRPFYSGKHKKHGMNVQVVADPSGRLLWASPALPGAVHDVRAAREHGVIDALVGAGIVCWADKGYQVRRSVSGHSAPRDVWHTGRPAGLGSRPGGLLRSPALCRVAWRCFHRSVHSHSIATNNSRRVAFPSGPLQRFLSIYLQ
ncbi:transposase family protein [Streptomyces krungchingensis]